MTGELIKFHGYTIPKQEADVLTNLLEKTIDRVANNWNKEYDYTRNRFRVEKELDLISLNDLINFDKWNQLLTKLSLPTSESYTTIELNNSINETMIKLSLAIKEDINKGFVINKKIINETKIIDNASKININNLKQEEIEVILNNNNSCYKMANNLIKKIGYHEILDKKKMGRYIYFEAEKDHINELNINACWLKEIPESITLLNKLEDLRIVNNPLKEIPPFLTRLKHLKRLELGNNRIKEITNLKGLTNLEYLGFSGNDISVVDPLLLPSQFEDEFEKIKERERTIPKYYSITNGKRISFSNKINIINRDYEKLKPAQLSALKVICKQLGISPKYLWQGIKTQKDEIDYKRMGIRINDDGDLTELQIKQYPINSIPKEITLFNELKNLDLFYTNINNIKVLSDMQSLEELCLDYTLVRDVSCLKGSNLKTLYLRSIITPEADDEIINNGPKKVDMWDIPTEEDIKNDMALIRSGGIFI
ncbi:MAG: leucine-rich repeat domain-containing protein [Candidatus Nanoarchaeia archaeon]|jgi:Leucine-rich repeat (LRR) protein